MNTNVSCPDCHSNDIQEINKTVLVTNQKGLPWWAIVLLVVFYPVGIIYLLLRLFGLFKPKNETKTETYYACRSCGHEFH